MAKSSRFDLLNNVPAREKSTAGAVESPGGVGEAEVEASAASATPARRSKSKPIAKKNNPAYKQFSAFVPKEMYRRIKSRCFLSGEDLSDFVERAMLLLEEKEPGPKQ